jgi:hypothetical protein
MRAFISASRSTKAARIDCLDFVDSIKAFAALVDRLYYTHANNDKAPVLAEYLRRTPDPDRGFAVGVIAG